jgi:putative selenate reductase
MSQLVPIPFEHLLRRIFYEFKHQDAIFDLPSRKFYRGKEGLDTSVFFCGNKAGTPAGPAAGPHTQLAQNIVLSWLAGARIIELKTVQINDQIKVNRPCIDITTIGYNAEWSQELRLEESLREYVKASMLIDVIHAANLLHPEEQVRPSLGTVFDVSVGYDLAGIQSRKIRTWLETMKDANWIVEEFRKEIPENLSKYQNLDFKSEIANSVTLSTFHGCPAGEIEQICSFLLKEMNFHVIIKMNPPMLGREKLEHLLYNRLGYSDIEVEHKVYGANITFADASGMVMRLKKIADEYGKVLGVKFTNTLEVKNKGSYFKDDVVYLSGEPLHVIALSLVDEWRKVFGDTIPISFSAGIDANNFPDAVGINLVPVTACTDLLRPGGYGHLQNYLVNLESRMESLGVQNVGDYIIKCGGNGPEAIRRVLERARNECRDESLKTTLDHVEKKCQANGENHNIDLKEIMEGTAMKSLYEEIVGLAGLLNTPELLQKTVSNERYYYENNSTAPRKIDSNLNLWDCINCDKCIPVCPNDANFSYEIEPLEVTYSNYKSQGNAVYLIQGSTLKIRDAHQIANYADLCNDCGNCDVFCPEHGGPYVKKPRFFSTFETYSNDKRDGFFMRKERVAEIILGRIKGKEYTLSVDTVLDRGFFSDGVTGIGLDWRNRKAVKAELLETTQVEEVLDMENFHIMAVLLEGVMNSKRSNYSNAPYL